jgi:hypothetical protein
MLLMVAICFFKFADNVEQNTRVLEHVSLQYFSFVLFGLVYTWFGWVGVGGGGVGSSLTSLLSL